MSAYRKTVVVPVKTGSRDHRHSNQVVLDSLTAGSDGGLLYNNIPVVDANLLEQSLDSRDLLLVPYLVTSYSTYLSLSSGLPRMELMTFDELDPVDLEASQSVSVAKYNTVLDTSETNAQLVTKAVATSSPYQMDNRARSLMVTTIPSYSDLRIEVQFDSEGDWYGIHPDRKVKVLEGFGNVKVRLALPRATDPRSAKRKVFGLYILYK